MNTILVVEDDVVFSNKLAEVLQAADYSVDIVHTGEQAVDKLRSFSIDLCLMDVGLPDCSGYKLCNKVREFYYNPIIMLTSYDGEDDIIVGLQSGADDYVTKPCSTRILLSRIASQLRKTKRTGREYGVNLFSGDLMINLTHRMILKNGTALSVGNTEFELCVALANSDGLIMPRHLLLDKIWDNRERFIDDNTLSVHVSRLRKKLGEYCGQSYIDTVKGIGYRWTVDVETR